MRTIEVLSEKRLDFARAQQIALRQAARHLEQPMPLSWHDWFTGEGFPDLECCSEKDCRPGWLEYGEDRGGDLRVDVGEEFSFIIRDGVGE